MYSQCTQSCGGGTEKCFQILCKSVELMRVQHSVVDIIVLTSFLIMFTTNCKSLGCLINLISFSICFPW
jgi:hypothetical protein